MPDNTKAESAREAISKTDGLHCLPRMSSISSLSTSVIIFSHLYYIKYSNNVKRSGIFGRKMEKKGYFIPFLI